MKFVRKIVVIFSLFLWLGSVSYAEEHPVEAFWVLPAASKEGELLTVGSKQYRAKKVALADVMKSCRIVSDDNFNTQFDIKIVPPPSLAKDFIGLLLKGNDFVLDSPSHSSSRDVLYRIDFFSVNPKTAEQVAEGLKVKLEKREHPGYLLQTRFICKNTANDGKVILEITNAGEKTIIFQDGGMNRGERNNQFSFVGFLDGKALPDIGSPLDFGGLAGLVTLKKGEKFEKEVELTKWFDLSKKGNYNIVGSFYLEFQNSDEKWETIWTDYATAGFWFEKQ